MKIHDPGTHRAPYGLRAMAMVARAAAGGLAPAHRALLDAVQRQVLGTEVDVEQLPEITAEQLAARLAGEPALARQLVQGMVLMSLAVGPTSPAQLGLIEGFAEALRVREPAVRTIGHLVRGNRWRFRLSLYRRGNVGDYLRQQYRRYGGLWGIIRALARFKGLAKDAELAAEFRALEQLPADTLGHALYRFYEEHGLSFPGEPGGFLEGGMFHDFTHVLGGYDAHEDGELLNAAFQAGYRRTPSAVYTLMFAMVIHCAGVDVTPFEVVHRPGRIGEGDMAEQVILALRRGAAMTTDLGDDWDYREWLDVPLEEARERLGITPLPRPPMQGSWSAAA